MIVPNQEVLSFAVSVQVVAAGDFVDVEDVCARGIPILTSKALSFLCLDANVALRMDAVDVPLLPGCLLVQLCLAQLIPDAHPGEVVEVIGCSPWGKDVLQGDRLNPRASTFGTRILPFDQVLRPGDVPHAGTEFHAILACVIEGRKEVPVESP